MNRQRTEDRFNNRMRFPSRIEKPTKGDIRDVARLVEMLDFMKVKYLPFSKIAREAVGRGIIKSEDIDSLYGSFTRVENT